tara:strand:- start:1871 stop:2416 length:546 start_codon:yes stop_codon:yes gene_type:complete
MTLTQVNSDGLKDGAVKTADIADEAVDLTKLPHGDANSNGKFLRSNNGADPTWETVTSVDAAAVNSAGAVMNTDLDGKGELLVGDGSGDPTALAVGTNAYVLTADSSEATGVKWAEAAAGANGNGPDKIFWENDKELTYSYTVTNNQNAMVAGPLSIAATGNGNNTEVILTVGDGETLTIV